MEHSDGEEMPSVSRLFHQHAGEPTPPDSRWPRYCSQPWPAYRFVPGVSPHPRRHPSGHSYGQGEPVLPAADPDRWCVNDAYLFGVDLYNYAFWWECHEIFETLWRASGTTSEPGRLFQALIHVAAGNLKRWMGSRASADRLSKAALERFQLMPQLYMGIDIRIFARDVQAYVNGSRTAPALIQLHAPADNAEACRLTRPLFVKDHSKLY